MDTEKSLTLYHVAAEIADLLESDEEDALARLETRLPVLEAKASSVAAWINYAEDMAEVLKRREAHIATARKAMEGKASRAREYLKNCMEGAGAFKITDTRTGTTLALQKNPLAVIVDDEKQIPPEFWRQPEPPPPQLDKRALGQALKTGPVNGCHIEQSLRLVIK